MPKVEIFVDVGGSDLIPHTFIGIAGQDGHRRRNFFNQGRKCVSRVVPLLAAFIFLAAVLPASAGHPYAELSFEISDAVLHILKKHGFPVARDRETPWLDIDGIPGRYSIIFYRADEIPQGVVLETVKLCMDLYKKQGLKERLERIRIFMYRESKEQWRKSLFLGIGGLTKVKPFFELTIGRR